MIAGTDPLRIYVYNEGLARFCTEPYQTPKSDNLDNKYMHLTNYAINKLSPNFIFNEEATCIFSHKQRMRQGTQTISFVNLQNSRGNGLKP
jgi:tubulin polyglutamylase TTLL6/13